MLGLRAGVRAWMELWKLLTPDVIVTDHAPTAVLAAQLAQIPNLPIGPGFCVPLCADPMPAFKFEHRDMEAALRAADARVLPDNEVAQDFGRAAFASVAEVFENPNALVTSFPELDPFGPRENAHYIGPITAPGRYRKVEWLGQRLRRVFVYL